jgi:hypothetical protein
MRGWRPQQAEVTVRVNNKSATENVDEGSFEIRLALDQPLETPFLIEIDCHPVSKAPNDDRSLAFVLIELRVEGP